MQVDSEPSFDTILQRARAAWPSLRVDHAKFERYLLSMTPNAPLSGPGSLKATLAKFDPAPFAADLYLAFACLERDPSALAIFDAQMLADVGAFISHIDRAPAFVDEVRQTLRDKLLVGKDGQPGLMGYRGRGALGGFVRVAAARTALNLRRKQRRAQVHEEAAFPGFDATSSPELAQLRERYREVFAEALRAAVAASSDRDRVLLRLYHAEGLPLESLAVLYRVHVSTASRWLACARERIAEGTLLQLRERLRVGASDARSIAALVMSQLDVSLIRLLRAPETAR